MGRLPSSQPPGALKRTSPQRARIAPRYMTEERIFSISVWGMWFRLIPSEFTSTSPPFCITLQPR